MFMHRHCTGNDARNSCFCGRKGPLNGKSNPFSDLSEAENYGNRVRMFLFLKIQRLEDITENQRITKEKRVKLKYYSDKFSISQIIDEIFE